jgi:hypothetical protein
MHVGSITYYGSVLSTHDSYKDIITHSKTGLYRSAITITVIPNSILVVYILVLSTISIIPNSTLVDYLGTATITVVPRFMRGIQFAAQLRTILTALLNRVKNRNSCIFFKTINRINIPH